MQKKKNFEEEGKKVQGIVCWINTYLRVVENGFSHPFIRSFRVSCYFFASIRYQVLEMAGMGDTIIKR